MNDCDATVDRMTEFSATGRDLPGDVAAHLATCESCRANWRLLRASARVGASTAASIDSDRMAEAVVSRLVAARRTDRTRRYWTWGGVMAAAAAIMLVVYTGRRPDQFGQQTASTITASSGNFEVPVSGLDDLDTSELQAVYDQLDGALAGHGSVAAPHLEELSPDEMEQVLNSLEG